MQRTRLLSVFTAAALLAGANGAVLPRTQAASGPAYNAIMNWFPEPEQGGYYNAQRQNLYAAAGVNTTIEEFGFSVVSFQYAEDKSIHSLADLSNHTLIYSFGAGFEPYLVQKYHYKNFKTESYDFTSRKFRLNPKAVNQCYVTSEPYVWSKQGLKVKYLLIASSGYSPYGDVIFTTENMIKQHPDVVRAFVKASVQGWNDYLKNGGPTNGYLETTAGAKNYPLTPDEINFDYSQLKRLNLIAGGDARTHGIGYMSLARWKTLQQQMVSTGQKVGGLDVSQAFTDQFLPTM
jgi:NitT/TauT family transport system substrate-binding protein